MSEVEELATAIAKALDEVAAGPIGSPTETDRYVARALIKDGWVNPPKKVKGDSPLGRIRELFKQLDHWERDGHTTAGIAYLRRHFGNIR